MYATNCTCMYFHLWPIFFKKLHVVHVWYILNDFTFTLKLCGVDCGLCWTNSPMKSVISSVNIYNLFCVILYFFWQRGRDGGLCVIIEFRLSSLLSKHLVFLADMRWCFSQVWLVLTSLFSVTGLAQYLHLLLCYHSLGKNALINRLWQDWVKMER